MVPLTAAEARRLFNLYTRASHPDAFHEHWSRWRRYHQAAARKSHYALGPSAISSGFFFAG